MKEALLIRKCRKRNARAQKLMVETYSGYLLGVCTRYVKDEEFAKDCLQETWIQIFWNLDKYTEEGKWMSWIAKVAIYKCKELLRREGRWKIEELEDEVVLNDLNREEIMINEETIDAFLNKLPQRYRIVVNLYLVESYNHKEIAEFLEINESTSRSLLSRALKMLRQEFEEPNGVERKTNPRSHLIRKSIYKKAII